MRTATPRRRKTSSGQSSRDFAGSPGLLVPVRLESLARELEIEAELAARASRESLPAFSELVFGLTPPLHIRPLIEALEAVEARAINRLLVILPPGHAKSTYCSIVFPAWYVGRHRDQHLIGISTTDKLAGTFGDTVREVIETSNDYRHVFPDAEPDYERGWSQDGFFVRRPWAPFDKDPTGVYVGAGGSIIGRRADGLLIDDPIDEPVARSETLLEQRKTWLKRSSRSRLKPGAFIVCSGTLWVEDDVVDSYEKSGDFVTIRMQARSASNLVYAEVTIPESVEWRPTGWQEGRHER